MMRVSASDGGLVIQTPAKVNLHLEVLGKRPDGYHELETLFVAVSLYDELRLNPVETEIRFNCAEADIGPPEQNLVVRAAHALRDASGTRQGAELSLTKNIPAAAGLAGGSSDAAATLVGLNQLWGLRWPGERLAELAAGLGSDVPFFLGTAAAVGRGRGELLTPVALGCRLDLVLVRPPVPLRTAEVFGRVRVPDAPRSIEPILKACAEGDRNAIAKNLHNRLLEAASSLSGAVADLQQKAEDWHCLGFVMSGSGAAFLALCSSGQDAERLGRTLRAQQLGSVFVVNSQ